MCPGYPPFAVIIIFPIAYQYSFVIAKAVPGIHHEALGAVFSVLTDFVVFEDAESFIDATWATDVFGVKDVAHIFGIKSVEMTDDGVEFCLEDGATFGVEREGLLGAELRQFLLLGGIQFVKEFLSPAVEVVVEVCELCNTSGNLPLEVLGDSVERNNRKLFDETDACMAPSNLLPGNIVER